MGGVIVMRAGKNALETIDAIKAKIATLQRGLPKGVEILATYDRSELIHKSVATLRDRGIPFMLGGSMAPQRWMMTSPGRWKKRTPECCSMGHCAAMIWTISCTAWAGPWVVAGAPRSRDCRGAILLLSPNAC